MAIATGTALLGAAVLGAGASIAGASAQKKAAKSAAQTAAQNTAANNATAERFYAANQQVLAPWQQSGLGANALFNAAIGIPAQSAFGPAPAAPAATPQASAFAPMPANFYPWDDGRYYGRTAQDVWNEQHGTAAPTAALPAAPGTVQTQAAPLNAQSAFNAFKASDGYQFRLNEGMGALGKAFGRSLDSGAAYKSAIRFGQGIASDEFGKWLQLLDNQQRLGFGAASAQAGVNQNMTSTLIGNNNAGASAAINARLYQGNANANMWQGLGSSFGTALGALSTNPYAFMNR